MPNCAFVTCKNRSKEVNISSQGITFHRFPRDPHIKEKWIDATGHKADWFPTKNSAICSAHFDPKCFQPSKKSRRLFKWAVPTLPLHKCACCTKHSSSKGCGYSGLDIKKEPKEEEESEDPLFLPSSDTVDPTVETQSDDHNSEKHEVNEAPRKLLRDYIIRQKNLIKVQKIKIRTLQRRCSRYLKRITELKNVVLENKRDIPPVMINKTQQVNFMYQIPKSTVNVPTRD